MKKSGLKGYLFEALIKKIVEKAGFRKDFDSKQLTWKRRRFHGRGAVHQIDVFGEFYFSVPFIYPINILGEVKSNKSQVGLTPVRNFCGVAKDIIEWYRIDTEKGGRERFSAIGEKRHTHCPVFFSLNGFGKHALEYMYAQGIYPVTYENNSEIIRIYKKFSGFLRQINFDKLPKKYVIFKNFEGILKIPEEAKKKYFSKRYAELIKLVSGTNPYFGMLGGKYVINLFLKKPDYLEKIKKNSKFSLEYDKSFFIKENKKVIAEFSFSRQFINYYLTDKTKIKDTFSYIDLFIIDKNQGLIIRINCDDESLEKLNKQLLKEKKE